MNKVSDAIYITFDDVGKIFFAEPDWFGEDFPSTLEGIDTEVVVLLDDADSLYVKRLRGNQGLCEIRTIPLSQRREKTEGLSIVLFDTQEKATRSALEYRRDYHERMASKYAEALDGGGSDF